MAMKRRIVSFDLESDFITSEMVDSGLYKFFDYYKPDDYDEFSPKDAVKDIFLAMLQASPQLNMPEVSSTKTL
jgi:hypothetical protein